MTKRNRATLSRIENLKKCGGGNANKRQKCDDMVAQPGKENQAAVRDSMFLLSYTTQRFFVVFQDTAGPSRLARDPIPETPLCLDEMQFKFQCPGLEARTNNTEGNLPLEHHFHEFQVNTEPDLEDIMDIFETSNEGGDDDDMEGLPDLLTDSEDEDSSDDDDDDDPWYSYNEGEGTQLGICQAPLQAVSRVTKGGSA